MYIMVRSSGLRIIGKTSSVADFNLIHWNMVNNSKYLVDVYKLISNSSIVYYFNILDNTDNIEWQRLPKKAIY